MTSQLSRSNVVNLTNVFRVKYLFSWLLLLGLTLSALSYQGVAKIQTESKVPPSFSYPEAMGTVVIDTPLKSASLAGKVIDQGGDGLTKVLVEKITPDRKRRLEATFTDRKGGFRFPRPIRTGIYYLRFSLPGYADLIVKVNVRKKAKPLMKVQLPYAN
jgi:hypothetical protein